MERFKSEKYIKLCIFKKGNNCKILAKNIIFLKFIIVVLPSIIARRFDETERLLIKNKSMVNSFMYGSHKRSILHKAAEVGDSRLCEILIAHGADVNKQDTRKQTPLWVAAEKGNGDVCKVLIQNGAFVDKEDATGKTPLWLAASKTREDICKMLIDRGADIVAKDELGISVCNLVDQDMKEQFEKWKKEYGKIINLPSLFWKQLDNFNTMKFI